MSRRWLSAVLFALTLTWQLPALAAGAPDPVEVGDEDESGAEDCPNVVTFPLLQGSCVVSYDSNATLAPGDDKAGTSQSFNNLTVTVRVPVAGVHQKVTVDPTTLQVDHPVYRHLNQTWREANDSRPDAIREDVTFESRPKKALDEHDGWVYRDEWGIFLMVRSPVGVGNEGEWIRVLALCWNICNVDDQDYVWQDEDTLRPFPNGIAARDVYSNDTDHEVAMVFNYTRACFYPGVTGWEFCQQNGETLDPVLAPYAAAYYEATPNVAWGARINRTAVQVKSTGPQGPTAETSSTDEPWLTNATQAVAPGTLPAAALPAAVAPQPTAPLEPAVTPLVPSSTEEGRHAPQETLRRAWTPSRLPYYAVAAGFVLALAVAIWPLYHRLTRSDTFEHPVRQRILEELGKESGLRVGTLASRLGVSHNLLKYHMKKLLSTGIVQADAPGSVQARYFLTGTATPQASKLVRALSRRTARAIYDYLGEHGETDYRTLQSFLRVHPTTVSGAVKRLHRAGLVVCRMEGNRILASRPSANLTA